MNWHTVKEVPFDWEIVHFHEGNIDLEDMIIIASASKKQIKIYFKNKLKNDRKNNSGFNATTKRK